MLTCPTVLLSLPSSADNATRAALLPHVCVYRCVYLHTLVNSNPNVLVV